MTAGQTPSPRVGEAERERLVRVIPLVESLRPGEEGCPRVHDGPEIPHQGRQVGEADPPEDPHDGGRQVAGRVRVADHAGGDDQEEGRDRRHLGGRAAGPRSRSRPSASAGG